MQQAVPVGSGAMAAILGLDAAKVIAGCGGNDTAKVIELVRHAKTVGADGALSALG